MVYQNRDEYLFVKVTNNNNYHAHMHRQVEIFYVLDGAIEITISGQKKLLERGMVSIAFPNVVHETFTPEHSSAVMIIFNHTFLPDFSAEFNTQTPRYPFLGCPQNAEQLSVLINGLLENTQKSGGENVPGPIDADEPCNDIVPHRVHPADIRVSKGYLYLLTAMILSQMPLARLENLYDSAGICQDISNYLNQHFTEELSLSQLADTLGYSKYHISHIFKQKFGCSYNDYLKRLRAEHAMGLLTHSELSVTEICFASGFSSLRSFYRAFHEIYGTSPRAFAP
ncbi:MAG: AraC family transcriptional regulator [Lachnospiraceae bacterium]|nr:AraC family transcriptional regulator [Lachnospiraceae bacterium]